MATAWGAVEMAAKEMQRRRSTEPPPRSMKDVSTFLHQWATALKQGGGITAGAQAEIVEQHACALDAAL